MIDSNNFMKLVIEIKIMKMNRKEAFKKMTEKS